MQRLVKWLLIVVALIVLLLVVMPRLLSSSVVKDRIAAQLSDITGREVTLNGRSSVSLRPYLGVTYSDVTIGSSQNDASAPLASVEELRVQLSFLSAFWGDAEISTVVLIRPRFNLEVDANGARNWQLQQGEFAKRLSGPAEDPPQRLRLGSAQIVDGSVKLNDQLNRVSAELTSVNGLFDWPDITSAFRCTLTAVWRGEIVDLELAASSPLEFLRGGMSSIRAQLTSKVLTTSFDGVIDTKLRTAKGQFDSVSPSMKSAMDWLALDIPLANITKEIQLSGNINAAEDKVTLENAEISIAENQGVGQLLLSVKKDAAPSISGTLAFETLNFPEPPLLAFGGVQPEDANGLVDLSKLKLLDLDVSVSAQTVALGQVEATNVAASMMLRKGALRLEIGNADILDGTASGFLDGSPTPKAFELRSELLLGGVNLETISSLISGTENGLTGTGEAELNLRTKILPANAKPISWNGELKLKSSNGTINGIDLNAIYDLSNQTDETQVKYINGTTDYDSLQLNFLLVNNTAFLRDSALLNSSIKASLTGRSALSESTLAMRGNIETAKEDATDLPLPFFVGGTLSSPLFAPLPRPQSN